MQCPEHQEKIATELKEDQIGQTELKTLYNLLLSGYNHDRTKFAQKSFFAELREKITHDSELQSIQKLLDEIAMRGEQIAAEIPPDKPHPVR